MLSECLVKYNLDASKLAYLASHLNKEKLSVIERLSKNNKEVYYRMILEAVYHENFKNHDYKEFMSDVKPLFFSEIPHFMMSAEKRKEELEKLSKKHDFNVNDCGVSLEDLIYSGKIRDLKKAVSVGEPVIKALGKYFNVSMATLINLYFNYDLKNEKELIKFFKEEVLSELEAIKGSIIPLEQSLDLEHLNAHNEKVMAIVENIKGLDPTVQDENALIISQIIVGGESAEPNLLSIVMEKYKIGGLRAVREYFNLSHQSV